MGGNSLTLMIACVSPVAFNYEETISTLRFAERAKEIKNSAKVNMDPMMLRIIELEAIIEDLKRQLAEANGGKTKSFFSNIFKRIKSMLQPTKVSPITTKSLSTELKSSSQGHLPVHKSATAPVKKSSEFDK